MGNIARVHKNCFEYDSSISRLIKAHKIRQIIHGKNHVEVADTKYFIAIVLLDMGKYTDSLLFFNDAMDVYKKIGYKPTHHVNSNIDRWVSFLENKLRQKELCKCSEADSKNKSTEVDVYGNAKNDMKRNSSKVDSMDNNSKTDTQGSEVNFKEGNNSFEGYNISQVDFNGNLSKDASKPDIKGNLPNLVPKG